MEPEAKYTLVGSIVLLLLALLAAALVWLHGTGEGRDSLQYKIYFERQSLEGLQARSDVKMKGIRVGTVTGFLFSSRRPGAVEVFITVEPTTPVRESTQAVVERHLVTGIASIRLINPTEDSPPLRQVPAGEPYPVIAEGESRLEQFSETISQLALRADETMQRVNAVLSPENQAALTDILANLRHITANTDRALAGLEGTLASIGGAADEVRNLSRGIAADARKLTARYDALGEDAGRSLGDVSAAVRRMSADVARLSERADGLLTSGDVELRLTAQELRATAEALGAAARRLGEPGNVLFGPPQGALGPGEAAR